MKFIVINKRVIRVKDILSIVPRYFDDDDALSHIVIHLETRGPALEIAMTTDEYEKILKKLESIGNLEET